MTDVRHTAGQQGEELAAEHFQRLGFEVLARNHRTRFGELDLVVFDGRRSCSSRSRPVAPARANRGEPHDRKRSKVRRMAIAWLTESPTARSAPSCASTGSPSSSTATGDLVRLDHLEAASDARPREQRSRSKGVERGASGWRRTSGVGLPAFTVVGLADKAVREARERVRAAMVNSGYEFPLRRITVNLAPAYLRKVGPAFDLPLAVACSSRSASSTRRRSSRARSSASCR